jgi:xylan 1,4-beta-xylosidase
MAVNFNEQFAYADDHAVSIQLEDIGAGPWQCRHYRIDRDHSNAYPVWLAMGRPVVPDDGQLAAIQARMGLELAEPPFPLAGAAGSAVLETVLPPQSVSLWVVDRG